MGWTSQAAAQIRHLKCYLDAAEPDGPLPCSQLPQSMRHQASAHMAVGSQAGALCCAAGRRLQGARSRSSLLKYVAWEAEDLQRNTSLCFVLQ